jgi:hypothetical protein
MHIVTLANIHAEELRLAKIPTGTGIRGDLPVTSGDGAIPPGRLGRGFEMEFGQGGLRICLVGICWGPENEKNREMAGPGCALCPTICNPNHSPLILTFLVSPSPSPSAARP